MKAYHVYLLRHGITQGNEEGRYVGRVDLPVSAEGKRQLEEMKKKYLYPRAELFFSSPRARCVQSLELLYPGEAPQIVENLAECDFGDYEGKLFAELKDDPEYQKWASGSTDSAPNGESSKAFQLRCCVAFEQIIDTLMRSDANSAVIMAHGGTIMSILGTYGFPRRPMYDWMTGSGMGFEALITPQLWMSGKAVEVVGAIPLEKDEINYTEAGEFTGEIHEDDREF